MKLSGKVTEGVQWCKVPMIPGAGGGGAGEAAAGDAEVEAQEECGVFLKWRDMRA